MKHILTLLALALLASTVQAQSGYYGGKYYGMPPSTHTYSTTRVTPLGQDQYRVYTTDTSGRSDTETITILPSTAPSTTMPDVNDWLWSD